MKNDLKRFAVISALACLAIVPAWAQERVATVNMDKVFNNYWKTKVLNAALKERAARLDQTDRQMIADCQKDQDDYQQLLDEASDPAVSSSERKRRKRAAEEKLETIHELQDNIADFEQQAGVNVSTEQAHMRTAVLSDINAVVANRAKAGGYSLVLDSSAQCWDAAAGGAFDAPFVLYTNSMNDITQSVLAQLNAGAPVDTSNVENGVPALDSVP